MLMLKLRLISTKMASAPVKPKLLLHSCCAPCSGYLAGELAKRFDVSIYYDNSNIFPREEYDKRLSEVKKFFAQWKIDVIEVDYNHDHFLAMAVDLRDEPERGKRCILCYYNRLRSTAEYACRHSFDLFGSTLAISPQKNSAVINNLGRALEMSFGIKFLAEDWKKNDGFKRATAFSKEQGFYRQNYCGCEFSQTRKVI